MFDEFKSMFALTLTDITWNWFEPIMNNIPDILVSKNEMLPSLPEASIVYLV